MANIFFHRRFLIPLLTPILLWLALPGGGELWPLLAIALVPLIYFLPELSGRKALVTGLLVGTIHHLLLLYWIVIVLGRYGGLPVFISVPALLLLAIYMSIYLAGFCLAARYLLISLSPAAALAGLPLLWVGLDWLRSWLFTGFPWMDLGYGLAGMPKMIQLADLFGHGSMTFLIVLINTLIALLLIHRKRLRSMILPVLSVGLLVIAVSAYSWMRWQTLEENYQAQAESSMRVGIVQGNVDQSIKWSAGLQRQTLDIYLAGSLSLYTEKRPELVVWPETALPFYPPSYVDLGILHDFVAQYNTGLLTGAPWYEVIDRSRRDIRYYNSVQLLTPDGRFSGSYYKSHLVPFGEYVPLKKFLPFLEPLVESVGNFSPGEVGAPLDWGDGRLGVLICFESIFPDISRKWVENGANMLINLTNDAWYGKSSAPYHSLDMTVFRAIETRRSVVRSANTGISGFIDPLGRVAAPSAIFTGWAAADDVVLSTEITAFVRWGYFFSPMCLLAGVILVGFSLAAKNSTPRC